MTEKEKLQVNVPDFIKNAKAGDILATKYNHILMVEHVEIKDNHVSIYYYFNYEDNKLLMNEWLTGFYGPKFDDENFYRPATDKEKDFFLSEMKKYGYIMENLYNKLTPIMTPSEFHRRYCTNSLPEEPVSEELEEAANDYADKHGFRVPYDGSNNFYDDTDVKASKEGFIAGANWQKERDFQDMLRSDHTEFIKCYEQGKSDMKEQMMKDAVKVSIVNAANVASESQDICGKYFSCVGSFKEGEYCPSLGDKIKLIIIKED